ncbi:helix-turn-helix domain-containing protein [Nocardioides limicola]|uniref:helix-turn-helix domain-containing protein n=1 Tax=Nocardioides limicola TaxID=2803368 RepID=UPI00193B2B2B|nr:helix-turn-helix domain-containing protein [Nocardioides sp. DJM-14]
MGFESLQARKSIKPQVSPLTCGLIVLGHNIIATATSPNGDTCYCRRMTTVRVERASDLGPALRNVRVAEAITQSALANIAGVGRQWLNAFEMGDKPTAPLDMVMRVAAALGVSVSLTASAADQAAADTADGDLVDLDELLDDLS